MSNSLISADMEKCIGRVYERLVSYPIGISDIRRWAIATYFPEVPPREFWDQEFAQRTRYAGIVAPYEFNPFAWITREPTRIPPRADGADINGIEKSQGIDGPKVQHSLNGGLEARYGAARMRPGDVITSETSIESYAEKDGRMGVMLMTRLRSTWTNQDGELVKQAHQTIIRY
jgi:hypothetical protein